MARALAPPDSPPPRPRSRALARALALGCSLACALSLGELLCRGLGLRPFRPGAQVIAEVVPGPLLVPHPRLGWDNGPGPHLVTYSGGLEYAPTHDDRGHRITREPLLDSLYAGKPRLEIYGCSFTYGWSVADEETYAYRIQAALPEWDVVNLGVAGHGTLHLWLRLRERLASSAPPKLVVLTYAALHDERNTLSRRFRKAIVGYSDQTAGLRAPRARLGAQGLELGYVPLGYEAPPGIGGSALAHLLESGWNQAELTWLDSHDVSRWLLRDAWERCQRAGVACVVAGITDEPLTGEALAELGEAGVPVVDISCDLSQPEHNLLPHDWHPSAEANAHYARRLLAYLASAGLLAAGR